MISLGIDPGTRRIGYGILSSEQNSLEFITAGILKITSTDDPGALLETKREIDSLLKKHKPDAISIEKLFFTNNQKTGIQVAQARGVILLAMEEYKIKAQKTPGVEIMIREYTPNEVKLGVTGYGAADKQAVFKMVCLILGRQDLKMIDDASDALALAILGTKSY